MKKTYANKYSTGGGESNYNRITSKVKDVIKEILGDSTSLFLLGIFLLVSLVSIGYSALSSSLMVTGEANFRVREDVRITGIKVLSFENEGYETYTAEYYKDGTKVMVTLPKTNSKVTYEVEIKNTSEDSYQLKSINDVIKSNEQMKYEIEGLNLDDIIGPSETKIFQIVVSYQDGTSEVPNESTAIFETRYVFEVVRITPPRTAVNFAGYLKSMANPDTIITYADENGNQQEMYTFFHEKTEQTGELTDYRYIGDNPNNYVYFNCIDDSKVETCEKWRIIGVFPVENENGNVEDRVKIIRETNLVSTMGYTGGGNDWTKASLNTYLNGPYYNVLSETSKTMIEDAKYYLGGAAYPNTSGPKYYEFERGNTVYGDHEKYWTGKIALMYPSDYIYTYSLGVNDRCYQSGGNCSTSYNGAPKAGWMYDGSTDSGKAPTSSWFISPYSANVGGVLLMTMGGSITTTGTGNYKIRPTLYLASDTVKVNGDGTFINPYVILPYKPTIVFNLPSGTYIGPETITITANSENYSHMEVEVTNSHGIMKDKSNSNIIESTYTITMYPEDTYTISVKLCEESGCIKQEERQYVIKAGTFAEYLKLKSNSGDITIYMEGNMGEMYTFSHPSTSQTSALTDYRYIGLTPNNYVYFNCQDVNQVSTCEKWRIIGVFRVQNENGAWEERVKIIRGNSLTESMAWDTTGTYATNRWESADIQEYLNQTYYDSLSAVAQKMTGKAKWYLGGTSYDLSIGQSSQYYAGERGSSVYSGHLTNWTGNIGLMYPSDLTYTYTLGVNDRCGSNIHDCSSGVGESRSGWILNSNKKEGSESLDNQWTMGIVGTEKGSVYYIPSYAGFWPASSLNTENGIRPTLYLTSDVMKSGGSGTFFDPYVIDLPTEILFDFSGGTYVPFKKITVTVEDFNYSYMNVEVRNQNGRVESKSQNNITEDTYTVTLEEEGTYTISVTAYDKDNFVTQAEQQYVIKIPENFVTKLKSKVNSSDLKYTDSTSEQKREMYPFKHEATEQTGELTDYRYIGIMPNNFVYFNCKKEPQNSSNCERWRIIGVFPVEDENGNIEERVKIIGSSYGVKIDRSSDSSNDWTYSILNKYLNETYYNSLSDTSQAMIGNTKYYLGMGSSLRISGEAFYKFERGTRASYNSNWVGKIALMYPSDWVYTYALGVNSTCYSDGGACQEFWDENPSSGWLFSRQSEWLLSPRSVTDYVHSYTVSYDGGISSSGHSLSGFLLSRPVLYLSSGVSIIDGDGSSSKPYQLAFQ